ncbi:hypothetical protein IQ63_28580 [Streptomyces acidiscabies]|uniref:Ricin B lectin domain-containing protein n=1 Tax=Streptomyces acidiscabies TaxID=42234 RepID=A0A0L0JYJ7_9ACTN|nr:hypothetical protein IQ63_28580 [Streptomyces acidiscabies]
MPYPLFTQEDSQAATIDTNAYYRLASVSSGKVLDVNGFSTTDGTRIQQWTDQNTANQQWRLRPTGKGRYELVNRGSGKTAPGASYQALYLIGTVKDVTGVFRSTDKGATWLRVNDDAHQWGGIGSMGIITGDPDTFGRVYVGTNGRGLQYGDPS